MVVVATLPLLPQVIDMLIFKGREELEVGTQLSARSMQAMSQAEYDLPALQQLQTKILTPSVWCTPVVQAYTAGCVPSTVRQGMTFVHTAWRNSVVHWCSR